MTATHYELRTSLASGRQADTILDRDAVNKCLRSLAPSYLAELCWPVIHLTGRRHLRSAASGKLNVQRTATAIGRRNFAVSDPEIWNS